MKRKTVPEKIEALARKHYGAILRYRGQNFQIKEVKTYARPFGLYVTAIEAGRVRKGDAQWLSYRYLREALAKAGAA